MNIYIKKTTAITLALLASTIMFAALATAQTTDQAVVVILASAGGTTNPAPGNYTYDNTTAIMLTAMPDEGFEFSYWVVSGEYQTGHTTGQIGSITDPDTGEVIQLPRPPSLSGIDALVFTANPANITCGYGYTYTYQAVFAPLSGPPSTTPPPQTSPATNTSQIVTIVPSIGGSTNPTPGTYTYSQGQALTLSATPEAGFAFHYWVVTGTYNPGHLAQPEYIPGVTEQFPSVPSNIFTPNNPDSLVFSINPVTITCGYGYSYTYQAVFTPATASIPPIPTNTPPASAAPTPTVSTTATPTAQVTPTPTPAPTTGTDYTWAIIAAVVVIIIIIVVAAVMMRKKK